MLYQDAERRLCVCAAQALLPARLSTTQHSPGADPTTGMQVVTNAYKQVTVSQKKLKVAINGFGRIGRAFVRCQHARENSNLEVVVINDSGGVKQASHLLKYDSTYGTFPADVKVRLLRPTARGDDPACRPGSAPGALCNGLRALRTPVWYFFGARRHLAVAIWARLHSRPQTPLRAPYAHPSCRTRVDKQTAAFMRTQALCSTLRAWHGM